MKASSAAGDPSPPPPRRWLSGLVSGAGRLLAAVLDSESSASDTTSSSPESSQSPPRRDQATTADHGIGKCFPSDSHQLNLSGKGIILKDSGEGSLAVVSEIDPKDAIKQLLMKETYSWSECDALIKIIQERVVDSDDEPAAILPIAWQANTQQHPVAYSSSPNSTVPAVSKPANCPVFDNIVEKEWPKKSSTVAEGPCTNSHDRFQRAAKRSYSPGDIFEDARRISPKRNKSNSFRNHGVSSKEATSNATKALSGFPEDVRTLFKDVPLLGTNNLTFSDLASKGVFDDEPSAVAAAAQQFTSTSCQADWDKCGSGMSYPYSSRNQPEMSHVKAELLDEPVPLKTDMTNPVQKDDSMLSYHHLFQNQPEMSCVKAEHLGEPVPLETGMTHLVQKNDRLTVVNGSCSVSNKSVSEGYIEAAPSSSMGLQTEKSSRNYSRGFNFQNSIPTKRRSPARTRPSNNRKTVRSWYVPPQQWNPAAGQEADTGRVQAKRPVRRPRKEWR